MRFATFDVGMGPQAGRLDGDHLVPLTAPGEGDLGALLRAGALGEGGGTGVPIPLSEVRLLPPVLAPEKIVCIGLNYHAHAEEAGLDAPERPTFFAKYANALVGNGATVTLPPYSRRVDYEAEVAFVIGRRCKDVEEAGALDVIAGYTLLNDLSARDFQMKTPQWGPGKVFDGSAPCGPYLVTPGEAGAPDAIEIALTRNGDEMQRGTTADLVHSIPALVAHLSMLMTLEPGDIVSTGTPAGVGSLRDPRVWLEAGDELAITSPQLGELQTTLA